MSLTDKSLLIAIMLLLFADHSFFLWNLRPSFLPSNVNLYLESSCCTGVDTYYYIFCAMGLGTTWSGKRDGTRGVGRGDTTTLVSGSGTGYIAHTYDVRTRIITPCISSLFLFLLFFVFCYYITSSTLAYKKNVRRRCGCFFECIQNRFLLWLRDSPDAVSPCGLIYYYCIVSINVVAVGVLFVLAIASPRVDTVGGAVKQGVSRLNSGFAHIPRTTLSCAAASRCLPFLVGHTCIHTAS